MKGKEGLGVGEGKDAEAQNTQLSDRMLTEEREQKQSLHSDCKTDTTHVNVVDKISAFHTGIFFIRHGVKGKALRKD